MAALLEAAATGMLYVRPGRAEGPRRALVLEDEESIGELWTMLLRKDGYDVVCRQSALGLGALLRRWHPDVILLDLGLPFRSGATALADFKADPATAGIPIVVLSGAPDSLSPARAALAAAVLTKPVGMQTLLATIGAAQSGGYHPDGSSPAHAL
jgi:DNA-binding response OmpR family regulator